MSLETRSIVEYVFPCFQGSLTGVAYVHRPEHRRQIPFIQRTSLTVPSWETLLPICKTANLNWAIKTSGCANLASGRDVDISMTQIEVEITNDHAHKRPCSQTTMLTNDHAHKRPCSQTTMLTNDHAHKRPCSQTTMLTNDHAHKRPCSQTTMLTNDHAHKRPCSQTTMLTNDHAQMVKVSNFQFKKSVVFAKTNTELFL